MAITSLHTRHYYYSLATDILIPTNVIFKDMGFGSDDSSDESDKDEDAGNRNDGKYMCSQFDAVFQSHPYPAPIYIFVL